MTLSLTIIDLDKKAHQLATEGERVWDHTGLHEKFNFAFTDSSGSPIAILVTARGVPGAGGVADLVEISGKILTTEADIRAMVNRQLPSGGSE